MSYKGRVIGFILGLLLAKSWIASLIFMVIGYFLVDKPANSKLRDDAAVHRFTRNANYNYDLVRLTFELMGYVARGAGRINEDHIDSASKVMAVMGLNAAMKKEAIDAFNRGKGDGYNLEQGIARIKRIIGSNFSFVSFILEIQIQLALSDGILSDEEYNRLIRIAVALGASRDSMDSLISRRLEEMRFSGTYAGGGFSSNRQYEYRDREDHSESGQSSYSSGGYSHSYNYSDSPSKLDLAYKLLDVSKTDTDAEVKKAYKRLMLKYHPDRLASQGLTPEMIKLYTEKAKDIQEAFDLIKQDRGMK